MNYAFQLFSARKFGELDPILGRLREFGYTQTEGWVDLFAAPGELRRLLDKNGLSMPTGHFSLAQLQDRDFARRTAETFGIELLICPWIEPERRADHAAWEKLADELARLAEAYRGDGLRFGWHSHEFEFVPTERGALPMDMLLAASPHLEWEYDIAWSAFGHIDPHPWLRRHGDRITAIHIRDLAPPGENLDEDGGTDIGHGTLDWPALIAAVHAHTACEFFVFEHDDPNDVLRFARRSMDSARRWPVPGSAP